MNLIIATNGDVDSHVCFLPGARMRLGGGMDREPHVDGCASVRRAIDMDRPADGFDSVNQTGKAGSGGWVRAPSAVVADGQLEAARPFPCMDRHLGCVRVFGGIGERLGGHVVARHFNRLFKARIFELET